jgi:beta-glucanase (GH16 family)
MQRRDTPVQLRSIGVASTIVAMAAHLGVASPAVGQDAPKYSTAAQLDAVKQNFAVGDTGQKAPLGSYPRLAFEDNFDTLSMVDDDKPGGAAKWFAPSHSTFGWAIFPKISASSETYTVQDGMLRLRMQRKNGVWYGAHIATTNTRGEGFTFSKGYVEVRMKVAQGLGGWSGFWMTSLDSTTTGMHGEIDVVESYGTALYGYNSALHLWPGKNPPSEASQVHWAAGVYPRINVAADDTFHTYGCELTDDLIIFYQDGVETSRAPRAAEWKDGPWRLQLSVAGGPDRYKDQAVSPVDMLIDSVRVWTD